MFKKVNMKTSDALSDGRVYVRKAWKNKNKPGQVGVQFIQEIDRELKGTPNNLISIAQGTEAYNRQRVTTILSFNEEIAVQLFGAAEFDLSVEGEAMVASEAMGTEVSIQVTENFTPNAFSENHEPKINPSSGEIVTGRDSEGELKPVYRHTKLVEGSTCNHTFIVPEYASATEESVAKEAADTLGKE